jgi:CO/xanthine dehydrogenase FAD-binding subunit
MKGFTYSRPTTIDEGVLQLSKAKGQSFILAGGTDMIPLMHVRRLPPMHIVDIKRIESLKGIQKRDGQLWLGSTETVHDISRNPEIARNYPALHQAALSLGSYPVRCQATIGGNICRASPSGDLLPSLLLYDASVGVVGREGRRIVKLNEFFWGPGKTVLQEDEILADILLPAPKSDSFSAYLKHSPRRAMDLAVVGVAVGIWHALGRIEDVRVALGAVGPTPFRALKAESTWKQKDPVTWEEIGSIAATECNPISDIRGSEYYRRKIVAVHVTRMLRDLAMRVDKEKALQ